jgi:hypothetical protein
MYVCWISGASLDLKSPFAKHILTGLLHPLFCAMYELTGVNNNWLWWGGNILALKQRVFKVPVMAFLFHFAIGFFFSFMNDFSFKLARFLKFQTGTKGDTLFQIGVVILSTPLLSLLFDIPTFFLERVGISRVSTVGLIFILSFGSFFNIENKVRNKKTGFIVNSMIMPPTRPKRDFLAFFILLLFSLLIVASIAIQSLRSNSEHPYVNFVLIDVAVALSVFFFCLILSHPPLLEKKS